MFAAVFEFFVVFELADDVNEVDSDEATVAELACDVEVEVRYKSVFFSASPSCWLVESNTA